MIEEKPMPQQDDIDPRGYWEQEGHNPLVAAVVFILLIGSIYFFLQTLVLNGYIMIDMALNKGTIVSGNGFLERIETLYKHYQIPILLIVMGSQFFIFLLPTVLFYRRNHFRNWRPHFHLQKPDMIAVLSAVLGTLLFLPLAEVLSSLFYYIFPDLAKWSELQTPLFEASSPGLLLLLILVIGLTPAICEEFLFRGYLQTVLQRKVKGFSIIMISGLLFGLYHQNPTGLIALTAAGLWLGLLAWKFQNLFASMIGHFVYNSTIILMVNGKIGAPFLSDKGQFTLPVTLLATCFFALLTWWIWVYGEKYASQYITGEDKTSL